MKKLIQIAIIVSLLLLSMGFAHAADGVNVSIDGVQVVFTDDSGSPFIDANNRTQVPFRQTLEAFGAEVTYDADTKTAIAEKDGVTVKVPIGADYIYRDDLKIPNDTTSMIMDSRTYLPIRIVLEAFGADVTFDATTQTVMVKSDGETLSMPVLAAEISAATDAVKSMDATMVMNMSIQTNDQTTDVTSTSSMNMFYDPIRLKVVTEATTNASDQITTVEEYMVQTDAGLVIYANAQNAGFTKVMTINMADYNDMLKNQSLFNILPTFTSAGTGMVNGVSAYQLQGIIPADMLDKIFSSSDFQSMISQAAAGKDIGELKAADIPMTIWVDPETNLILKYNFDLAAYMTSILQSAYSAASDTPVTIQVSKCTAEMTVSNINNATDFQPPADLPE